MSLILEALKRSEAERRLGEAPDLMAPSPEFLTAVPSQRPPWVLVAGIATLLVLGVALSGWWLLLRDSKDEAVPVAARADAVTSTQATEEARAAAATPSGTPALLGIPVAPPPRPMPSASLPAATAPPVAAPNPTAPLLPPDTVLGNSPVAVEPQAAPVPEPPIAAPVPPSNPAAAAQVDSSLAVGDPAAGALTSPQALPANTTATPQLAVAPPIVEAAAAVVEESPASDMPHLSDLPLAVRQSLPPLVLNMHLFRANPSERVVILDGKRLREGESAGDLQVAEIRSDGVVLVAQGQRFLLSRLPR